MKKINEEKTGRPSLVDKEGALSKPTKSITKALTTGKVKPDEVEKEVKARKERYKKAKLISSGYGAKLPSDAENQSKTRKAKRNKK